MVPSHQPVCAEYHMVGNQRHTAATHGSQWDLFSGRASRGNGGVSAEVFLTDIPWLPPQPSVRTCTAFSKEAMNGP